MKAYPTPKVQRFMFMAATVPESPLAADFVTFIVGHVPKLMAAGLRGYNWLAMNGTSPISPGQRWSGLAGVMTLLNKGPEVVQEIMGALNDTVLERFNGTAFVQTMPVQSYDSWLDYYEVNFDNNTSGGSAIMVSRLLDEEALAGNHEPLKKALQAATEGTEMIDFYLLGGKGVHNAKPRGGSNAVNPGWRKAYVHTRKFTGRAYLKLGGSQLTRFRNSSHGPIQAVRQGRREKGEGAARQRVRATPQTDAQHGGVHQRGRAP